MSRASVVLAAMLLMPAVQVAHLEEGVDPALAAARAAMGGDAALRAVATLTATGSLNTSDGQPSDIVLELAPPDRFRSTQHLTMPTFGSGDVVRVLSGDRAWVDARTKSAMPGTHIVQGDDTLSEDRLRRVLRAELSAFTLAWLLAPSAGVASSFEHDGEAERGERGKTEVLRTSGEQGHPVRLFLDARTHRPVRVQYWGSPRPAARATSRFSIVPGRGGVSIGGRRPAERLPEEATIELQLEDFKTENGIVLAHRLRKRVDGDEIEELRVKRFSFNDVPKEAFDGK